MIILLKHTSTCKLRRGSLVLKVEQEVM